MRSPTDFLAAITQHIPDKGVQIQQVWYTDPLRCPVCQNIMRLIAVIDQPEVVEKIPRHLYLWTSSTAKSKARPPPAAHEPWTYEPCTDVDPMPDYENALTD